MQADAPDFKPENLPEPSRRALLNLAAGRDSGEGLAGRSAFGGHTATLRSLRRWGLVDDRAELTDAGRAAAARIARAHA